MPRFTEFSRLRSNRAAPFVIALLTAVSMALGSAPRPCLCGASVRTSLNETPSNSRSCCAKKVVETSSAACCHDGAMDYSRNGTCCALSGDRSLVKLESFAAHDFSPWLMTTGIISADDVLAPTDMRPAIEDDAAAGVSLQALYCVWRE